MSVEPVDFSDAGNPDPIEAAAATWLARRDRGLTADETVEFARWRSADPRHEATVAELGAMWSALDDLAVLREKPATKGGDEARPANMRQRGFLPTWAWAVAACVALGVGVLGWQQFAPTVEPSVRYETVVGDQRTITLPDGSILQLNTDSAAVVRYSAKERRVDLSRGEAFFTVTKDAQRPFIAAAAGVEARALGTAFTVRRKEKETELVVAEGRVKFSAVAKNEAGVEVGAGQVCVYDSLNPEALRVGVLDGAEVARRLAWKSGRFVCRLNMPLAEVVAEFNRYHPKQLVLRDEETGAALIGGGFELANLDAFVRALETSFDIVVVERDAERIVLKVKR